MISVIIAAYNSEKYLEKCIESILDQTYQSWEMIICDDASDDRTLQIANYYASKDKRIKVLHNERNMKAAATRNRCIENSIGEYIAIQDADDVSEPERLNTLLKELENSDYDFVSCAHYLFDDKGKYKTHVPKEKYPTKYSFLSGMPFCHAATLFRRNCLESVNGYQISDLTKRNEDYDLFMRLYANKYQGCNINDVLYGYRVDQNALRRRTFKYRIDECKLRWCDFQKLDILFPFGWIYTFRPLIAHVLNLLKIR